MTESLAELWKATCARAPEARAVIDAASGRSWTRAQLATEVANWRRQLPPAPELAGRAVLLAARNSPDWLAVWLALQDAGAVPAAMDADEPDEAQRAAARKIHAAWRWRGGVLEALPLERRSRRHEACLIKLTSGSTGEPRALPFTAAQMAADGRQVCTSMGITAGDVNFAAIPFGHSYGLGNLVLPLILQGTAIVIGSGPLPQQLGTDIERWAPTVFPSVPALLRVLVLADVTATALRSLRRVISAGAALPAETARGFREKFGHVVHGFYGSSETGGICYDRTGEATAEGRSVGLPLEGVKLEFGRGGRFVVRSPAVMAPGYFRPPDRAALNPQGELVLLGRTGRLVKIGGRRLDLGEIERAMRALPMITDVWVALHPRLPDVVACAAVSKATEREIRAALAARIASWKIPDRFLVLPEFPLTARGKTDTRKLRAML